MTQRETEVILKVNSKEAQDKLRKLEEQASDLRQKFAEAFSKGDTRGVDDINKKLQKVNKEINNMRTNAANIQAAMVRLNEASPRELQRTIKLINNELNSGRVKRGTKEWDEYVDKLKEVQTELRKVKKEMEPDDDRSLFDKMKDGINDWGATAATAAAAFAGVVMSGKAAVQAYADMEAEEANVRKYTGMTAEEVKRLNDEFKNIDTRTSREDLNKLAQEAGRLGKTSHEDVLGFVRAADQINVALDDLGEGATLTLSKLTGIFGDEAQYGTEQSLLKVGSVINELSQNCSASAPYLAEFSSRLGGIAAQSKMSVSQVMAFAAVLDTQNLAVEASSTAVGQLITKIYQGPEKIAKAAGLDVKKFADMVKTDMNGALIMLFEHLNKFGGMNNLAKVFDNMGTDGARAIPVLTALSGHIEELKSQQEEANKAFVEGTSITKEFSVQNNTVQAQLDKAKKGFTEMAVSLGEQLLPVMSYCISGTSLLMRVMNTLVGFFIKHQAVILTLTAAIAAYNVVMALHVNWSKLATTWTNLWTAAQTKFRGVASVFRLVVAGLTNTVQFFTNGLKVNLAMQQRWSKAIAGMSFGAWTGGVMAVVAALVLLYQKLKKVYEEQHMLDNIRDDAIRKVGEERVSLDLLIAAARDEKLSLDERKKAIDKLNEIIPDYNGFLDETTGKYQENKEALDEYIKSLTRKYEIEGAKDQLAQLGKRKADAVIELDDATKVYDAAKEYYESGGGQSFTTSFGAVSNTAAEAYRNAKSRLEDAQAEVDEIEELEKRITDVYGEALKANEIKKIEPPEETDPPENTDPVNPPESDEERKKREKEAKEALKKALEERKSLYLKADAENLTMYLTGQRDYSDYLATKEKLEKDYVDDVIKIHEAHNKIDILEYAEALKSKSDLQKKQQDAERKRKLKEIEEEHKENTDAATAAYFDPSSPEFQNKRILNQKLFQEDIRYLTEKRDLYTKGSEEWAKIDAEINERNLQDKLDKQKEFVKKLESINIDGSGTITEQYWAQKFKLQNSLKLGDIDNDEYNALSAKLDENYKKALKSQPTDAASEWTDSVRLVAASYIDLFKTITEGGANSEVTFSRIAQAAQASVMVIGEIMSQYSNYINAERDLELAKTEKRYDKEIAAAGKNTKKKEKLEKQKEADIAKIKKKYNDKAMKMELAQAIAQTAAAAINAYASASKEHWLLGPIAAAMATAAGMVQVATIKKQHEAEAAGYYEGGFTSRDANDRREVGVVHANEFVANHQAVANPALTPVLRLIDTAQRNNTVGSLTAADVSNAIGQGFGVSARGDVSRAASFDTALIGGLSAVAQTNAVANEVMTKLSDAIEEGIEAKVILDGEDGFHKKYTKFQKLRNAPKR